MGYLIDSNVLIDYVANRFSTVQLLRLDEIFDHEFNVSIITRIETLGFAAEAQEEEKLMQFFTSANIKPLTDEVADLTIELRKTRKLKTPDAIIAATAIFFKFTLLSRNTADFKNIPTLLVIDPHSW